MKNIIIKDFHAFHEAVETDFADQQQNILLYGENGSGKSSIYEALKVIFFYLEISQQITNDAVSPEDEQQRIREWKSKHLCKLSTVNDFTIKYDGEDYTTVDVSAYEVFMIDNNSLPLTDSISVRSLLGRVNFSNFDIDSFLENQAGFLLEYVNDALKESFFESLKLSYDETNEYRFKFKDPQRNDLEEVMNLPRCFNEAKLKLVSILVLLTAAELSMSINDPTKNKLLVLDDIINSLDVANRIMLIRYIFKHFPDDKVQKAVMTHNVSFFNLWHYYVNEILHTGNLWYCPDLVVSGVGHYLKGDVCTTADSIKVEFEANHNYEDTGNKLRRYFEYLLFKITKLLQVGPFNESTKLINNLFAKEHHQYFRVLEPSHEVLDVYDMVKKIRGIVDNAPADNNICNNIKGIIQNYNGDEYLDDLLPVIDDLKVYQKVALHQASHGHEGKDTIGNKEVYTSLYLLQKLERVVNSEDNKDVYTM